MNNNARITILGFVLLFSVGTIFILYLRSPTKRNHRYNSFDRKILAQAVKLDNMLDLKSNSYYISGSISGQIYFGNTLVPRHMVVTNMMLADTQHVVLNIEGLDKFEFRSVKVVIDSPNFYFTDGSVPAIFIGSITDWKAYRHLNTRAFFMELKPITKVSFIIRTISNRSKELILAKQTDMHPYIQFAPNLLEKQIDGTFCVDGMLHYDKGLSWLVYVYYYRNQFICADSSLNLIYRGNTIDTIRKAKIMVGEIKSDNAMTLASPPLLVNKNSCVSGNRLYINSNLLARNDERETFDRSSTIDVYNLNDGQYQFSFYIPDHQGKKIREFIVFGNMALVLSGHYAIKYGIDFGE